MWTTLDLVSSMIELIGLMAHLYFFHELELRMVALSLDKSQRHYAEMVLAC